MKRKEIFIEIVCIALLLLFIYAGVSKLLDYQKFNLELRKSPMLVSIGSLIAWLVPLIEIITASLLVFRQTRLIGLYASFILMTLFTVYLTVILNLSEFIPCSCGGVLQKMTWTQHILFNIVFLTAAGWAIVLSTSKRQSFISLPLTLAICSASVLALFGFTYDNKNKYSSFDRTFFSEKLIPAHSLDIGYNSYVFAGASHDNLYLGNLTAPLHVINLNLPQLDSQHLQIKLLSTYEWKQKPKLIVAPPHFYLAEGTTPLILKGDLQTLTAFPVSVKGVYFGPLVPFGPESFATRILVAHTENYELATLSGFDNRFLINDSLLTRQVDGRFCEEGRLLFNKGLNKVIYVYTYRNAFITTDTLLRNTYIGNTIDSIRTAKITVTTAGGTHAIGGNSVVVNRLAVTSGRLLYVNSEIRARNEPEKGFRSGSTIDVYEIEHGFYLGSFRIPLFNGEKLKEFLVQGQNLYAMHSTHVIRYDVSPILDACDEKLRARFVKKIIPTGRSVFQE